MDFIRFLGEEWDGWCVDEKGIFSGVFVLVYFLFFGGKSGFRKLYFGGRVLRVESSVCKMDIF